MSSEAMTAASTEIESYSEIIRYIGTDGLTARRVLGVILAQEEERADDRTNPLVPFDPKKPVR